MARQKGLRKDQRKYLVEPDDIVAAAPTGGSAARTGKTIEVADPEIIVAEQIEFLPLS